MKYNKYITRSVFNSIINEELEPRTTAVDKSVVEYIEELSKYVGKPLVSGPIEETYIINRANATIDAVQTYGTYSNPIIFDNKYYSLEGVTSNDLAGNDYLIVTNATKHNFGTYAAGSLYFVGAKIYYKIVGANGDATSNYEVDGYVQENLYFTSLVININGGAINLQSGKYKDIFS